MDSKIQTQIEKLQEELRYHRYHYYELNAPLMTDPEFDALHQQLLEYQKQYPEIVDTVGWKPAGTSYIHHHKMLSLRSTKELLDIEARFMSFGESLSAEPKIDGSSCELTYRKGRLVAAATRGDGTVGDDITNNILQIENIPKVVDDLNNIEIYGEIFITKEDFYLINQKRIRGGHSLYSSPRNAASGIVRSKEHRNLLQHLNFYPYTVYGTQYTTQSRAFEWLRFNKFNTLEELVTIINKSEDYYQYYDRMQKLRKELPFEIDGLVFKVNNLEIRENIGVTSTHPNWAFAFKFAPESVVTRLNDVIFQVGKSGIIAPVGILDEVKILNSNVNRAFLANGSKIREKDIRIGDMVNVSMANDIIPHIDSVVFEDRCGKEVEIVFPESCPVCKSGVSYIGPHLVCSNPQCPAQIIGRMFSAVGRKGFNIKDLGKVKIQQLIESNILNNLSDIFTLTHTENKNTLVQLYGEKVANKICFEIEKAKNIELPKLLFTLGIPDVGVTTSTKLAEHYGTLKNLIESVVSEGVATLPGVNRETLEAIDDYFRNEDNRQMIREMIIRGVVPLAYIRKIPLKKVAITGALQSMTKEEALVRLKPLGYTTTDAVTKDTVLVVTGDRPSLNKIENAQRYGIPIIPEQAFLTKYFS